MSGGFEFVLSSVEASVVGQALGVDVRRFPLRFRNTTTNPVRLIKLARLVTGELAKRRLVVGDQLRPELRGAFELFRDHRVAVAVTGVDGLGDDIAALAMTDGARALGVTQHGSADEMLFACFSDDEFVSVLAGVLPPMDAAPGPTATVRQSATRHRSALAARRAAERAHDEEETAAFGNVLSRMVEPPEPKWRAGADDNDHERMRKVLEGERLGGGQIMVSGVGERAAPHALSWLDTSVGRYLVRGQDTEGEFVARYEPAGRRQLTRALQDAVAQAYAGRVSRSE